MICYTVAIRKTYLPVNPKQGGHIMKKIIAALLLCLSLLCSAALADTCAICGGDRVCDACGGNGYVLKPVYNSSMEVKIVCDAGCEDGTCPICSAPCDVCDSDGKCNVCKGYGYVLKQVYGSNTEVKIVCEGEHCSDGKCTACQSGAAASATATPKPTPKLTPTPTKKPTPTPKVKYQPTAAPSSDLVVPSPLVYFPGAVTLEDTEHRGKLTIYHYSSLDMSRIEKYLAHLDANPTLDRYSTANYTTYAYISYHLRTSKGNSGKIEVRIHNYNKSASTLSVYAYDSITVSDHYNVSEDADTVSSASTIVSDVPTSGFPTVPSPSIILGKKIALSDAFGMEGSYYYDYDATATSDIYEYIDTLVGVGIFTRSKSEILEGSEYISLDSNICDGSIVICIYEPNRSKSAFFIGCTDMLVAE